MLDDFFMEQLKLFEIEPVGRTKGGLVCPKCLQILVETWSEESSGYTIKVERCSCGWHTTDK